MDYSKLFVQVPDRKGTRSCKWDELNLKQDPKGELDLIHLGVADMDFVTAPCVTDYLRQVVEHGVHGYSMLDLDFATAICEWNKKHYGVEIDPTWVIFVPRITTSAHMCVRLFTEEGDGCLAHIPLYTPLQEAITLNRRELIASPLLYNRTTGEWQIDFAQMEQAVTKNTKMLLLCDPHNPTTRSFIADEIQRLADFASEHDLVVFVDEIHADILRKGVEHHSLLNISPEFNQRLIVASSLTKVFNVPGIIVSWLIVPDAAKREKIRAEIKLMGMNNPTDFASGIVPVVYRQGEEWYQEMLRQIDSNEAFTRSYFAANFPELKISKREGTYLLWIDYSELEITGEQFSKWFIEKARVEVYMGEAFGVYGQNFIRLNLGTSQTMLEQAYNRMKAAWRQW